uniref:Uncharacterized protein n=1 Tax=Salix viminalis TaxID=40686 RepID=A0A6N2L869_SALVM
MQNSTGVEIGKSFRSGCSHSMCAHNKERITLIQRWKEEKLVGDSDRFEGGFQKYSDDRISQTALVLDNPSGQIKDHS